MLDFFSLCMFGFAQFGSSFVIPDTGPHKAFARGFRPFPSSCVIFGRAENQNYLKLPSCVAEAHAVNGSWTFSIFWIGSLFLSDDFFFFWKNELV